MKENSPSFSNSLFAAAFSRGFLILLLLLLLRVVEYAGRGPTNASVSVRLVNRSAVACRWFLMGKKSGEV